MRADRLTAATVSLQEKRRCQVPRCKLVCGACFPTASAARSQGKRKQDAGIAGCCIPCAFTLASCCLNAFIFFFFSCFSDLQRLGELQSELAGMADFTATYLQCQLLLIKVWLQLAFLGCSSKCPQFTAVVNFMNFDFSAENWSVMKTRTRWISDIPASLLWQII